MHWNNLSCLVSRTTTARLLPVLLVFAASVTAGHAQANFAGTEALVATLENERVNGFTVDPSGNIYICDASDDQLDEAVNSSSGYGALTTIVGGMCSPGSSLPPLAVDAAGYFYYATSSQIWKAQLTGGTFGAPILVAGSLNEPGPIAIDSQGNVYIDVTGTGQIVRVPFSGGTYGPPTTVMSGYSGSLYLAVDGSGSVYAAGGYGASSGFVVKAAFNGSSYAAPQTLSSGFNDLTGLAVDAFGNVFVSSDDNFESPIYGTSGPGAVVDLYEIPLSASGGYGVPVPMGGGDFYVAQGAGSDAAGNIYVLWIGGPRGGFSYNVEKVNPHPPLGFGSVSVGSASQGQVTFWVTGTELTPPNITVSTQGANGKDFTTAGGVNCVPDAGLPFNIDGYPVACSAAVTFAPQTTGYRTGGALLISGDTGTPIAQVSLVGLGAGPHLSLDPGASTLITPALSQGGATATDSQGNFYAVDFVNQRVVKLTWSGSGFGSPQPVATGLVSPDGIAVDGFGNVFISDSTTAQVVKVPWTGSGYGAAQTILTQTMFYFQGTTEAFAPNGLAVDLAGNVFVLELSIGPLGDSVVVELPAKADGFGPAVIVSGDGFLFGRAIATNGHDLFVLQDTPASSGPASLEQILEFQSLPNAIPGFAPGVLVVAEAAGYYLSFDGNGNMYYLDQSYFASAPDEVIEGPVRGSSFGFARTIYSLPMNALASLAVTPDGTLLMNNYSSSTNPGSIRVDRSTAAPLAFLPTQVGATSTDSPRKVVVENIGNQPLTMASLTYPADFPEAAGDVFACAAPSLASGASCDLPIQFTPLSSGAHAESVSFTDNSLNHAGTKQVIPVSGTGNGPVTDAQIQLSLTSLSYTYPGRATVTVKLLTGSSPHAPNGTVQLILDGNLLTTLTLSGAGYGNAAAYFELPILAASSHTLVAVYSGDAKNAAGTSQPLSFTVLPAPVSLDVSCPHSTIVSRGDFRCYVYTAPVHASVGTSIGVQYDNNLPYTIQPLNGVAVFNIPNPPIGPHHVVISYAAQGNYGAATPVTENFTVIAP